MTTTKNKNSKLKKFLRDTCGFYRKWNSTQDFKIKINFEKDKEIIFEKDSISVNTPVVVYNRCLIDEDTENLEKLLVKELKKLLSKEEKRLSSKKEDLLAFRNWSNIETALNVIGVDLTSEAYLSSSDWKYTSNWENFLTNQIQWVQFEYEKNYYAIIQLSFRGCDVRAVSSPLLVKLKEPESIYNISFGLKLYSERDHFRDITFLDPIKWEVLPQSKKVIEKETGEIFSISL